MSNSIRNFFRKKTIIEVYNKDYNDMKVTRKHIYIKELKNDKDIIKHFFSKKNNMEKKEIVNFNNNYVIEKIEENKKNKTKKIIDELKEICKIDDDKLLLDIYNKSISIHQSNNQGNGDFLENNIVVPELTLKNISFRQQVTIDKDGIIVGFNEKKSKCYHIVDFVIGKNIQIGNSITEYKVISCKTTCRERWTQDDWTFKYAPLKYILLTISNDYPLSARFRENEQRKIITCFSKTKDDRKYKLNFDHLVNEII
jgi:hypothetical protein